MEQWSRDQRYRPIESMPQHEFEALKEKVGLSKYRQRFHIQPLSGLLNHPNGLIYTNGQYHIAHQWFPLGAVHGLKYWYYYTSSDLVEYHREGVLLKPDSAYDSHGVYSGSAFTYQNNLYVMYTGNHRTKDWDRQSSQIVAKINNGKVEKLNPPAIPHPPKGYTQNFGFPKVFKRDGKLYAIIGAQRDDLTGCVVLYEAEQPESEWRFVGEIETDLENFGSFWDSPDFFQLNGKDVLLFCPRALDSEEERFQNKYLSGYIIGELDFDTLKFSHGSFQTLDNGFDFYAPQTFEDEVGRRVLIGWMGLPDTEYPTDNEGWAHCLTLPRTLTIESGTLKQKPHMNLRKLREEKETALGYANKFFKQLHPYEGKQYELVVDILENEASAIEFQLRASKNEHTVIRYNSLTKEISLERFDSGALPIPVKGTERKATLETELYQLRIFVDTSSIEIFCNEGERVLTSRIFPSENANKIRVATDSGQVYLKMSKYNMKSIEL
ncbi:sucrose-6-phosphate hydrolase [Staphylococcus felis]|uniref:sucrose-6-phosphate hydrolase n=1 Tax=Staphylococcus felis TaxID=46127 RepID=UPI000E27061D|nr:sucrose-6-phosphate hydrolase [Staphylococcus felis]REH78930.1 sucrose-6-phosphate hydrolase [Staphylococcus felis]REI33670.1 sucrose-6-phosphate hydrolase [Staphylococcus felis]